MTTSDGGCVLAHLSMCFEFLKVHDCLYYISLMNGPYYEMTFLIPGNIICSEICSTKY